MKDYDEKHFGDKKSKKEKNKTDKVKVKRRDEPIHCIFDPDENNTHGFFLGDKNIAQNEVELKKRNI